MLDPRLIDELVQRAKVSAADAEAVLGALERLAAEGRLARRRVRRRRARAPGAAGAARRAVRAGAEEVDALIAEARRHPLGVDFLLGGHLGTVAVTFKTHAFTVEAARARIWSER